MLRIATRTDHKVTTMKLSGRLASKWVDEFISCSRRLLHEQSPDRITVDLLEVTGADAAGKRALAEVAQTGVWLAYGDAFVQGLVEKAVQEAGRGGPVSRLPW